MRGQVTNEEMRNGVDRKPIRLFSFRTFPHIILTFHPCVDQGKLKHEHKPEACEQPHHENVVVQGGGAPGEGRSRSRPAARREPEHAEDEQEKGVGGGGEDGDGRYHVGEVRQVRP